MGVVLRVGLASTLKRAPVPAGAPVLDPAGPLWSIGGTDRADRLAIPVAASDRTLFGPRGACLFGRDGPLWVCDTGHHRLLGWARLPHGETVTGLAGADCVIGQPGFQQEGRNAKGEPGAATLNVPTGVARCGSALAVADAWNHRVLIWHKAPDASNTPADLVLGQREFTAVEANRGASGPRADSLFWPYGVHWDGAQLWVADTGNRRVLMWDGLPFYSGQPADLVLGQSHFRGRDENGGGEPNAASMRWPHGITHWQKRLCVADAGNNRIMVWDRTPLSNNEPADHMLGQNDTVQVDHNQSLYWPSATSLNMPYGISSAGEWLIVADTASSRLLAWRWASCATGAAASALTGQSEFRAKGDNRWGLPEHDSLSWPYGLACEGGRAAVCDSGNNRVLIWALAEELRGGLG